MERLKNMLIWSLVSGLGSASVGILAFLLPAYQAQKDRLMGQEVVEAYSKAGERLYERQEYSEAEEMFRQAFEYSDFSRLDLEIRRLQARVFKVYEYEDWKVSKVKDLERSDYLFLLETTSNPQDLSEYLGAYGVFLALRGEAQPAVKALEESVKLDPHNRTNLMNLGNAYDSLGLLSKSAEAYAVARTQTPAL